MDNTIIQEASASENMNGDTIDATPECAADVPADVAVDTTAAPAATETPAKSYDDLFPSLPTSAPGPATGGPASIGGSWNRKPVLASSTVTQVSCLDPRYINKIRIDATWQAGSATEI